MPGGREELALLEAVTVCLGHDAEIGTEAMAALGRACGVLLVVGTEEGLGAPALLAKQVPRLAEGVERVAAIRSKRDQRGEARRVAAKIEKAVRRWRCGNERAAARDESEWLHPWVWDAIHRACLAIEKAFAATHVARKRRDVMSFNAAREEAWKRYREVIEHEAKQFESDEPHSIVVGGERPLRQLRNAGALDGAYMVDILRAIYFSKTRPVLAAGFDQPTHDRYDATLKKVGLGDSGFGPVAATDVIVGKVVHRAAQTVRSKEKGTERTTYSPPASGARLGTPEDPWREVKRRRVGRIRRRHPAECRPDMGCFDP